MENARFKDEEIAKKQNNPTDLGWANSWKSDPEQIIKCHSLRGPDHQTSDIDVGPPHRGIEHVVRCIKCNYVYRYDSSD